MQASAGLSSRRLLMLLALTPGIGGRTLTRVAARIELMGHSPAEFLGLSAEGMAEAYGIKLKVAQEILTRSHSWSAEADGLERKLAERDVQLITAADAHYPARLEQFDPQAPGALFCYGNTRLLESKTFCVLSSRNTSRRGLELVEKWTEEGVFNGEVLVSGHDRPEYQRAALVPLRWGSPRILCFDRGMFHVLGEDLTQEPFRSARLWRYQFDPKTDLAISPFRPDATFRGVNNQVRDRLVAGLSDRLDGVELAGGGNMEKLVFMGLKCGRRARVSDRSDSWPSLREAGAEIFEG
jgi:predicted Rossmann fold nucleotide-binding protein DprA/Smf involved in DNA uptake